MNIRSDGLINPLHRADCLKPPPGRTNESFRLAEHEDSPAPQGIGETGDDLLLLLPLKVDEHIATEDEVTRGKRAPPQEIPLPEIHHRLDLRHESMFSPMK